MVTWTQPQASSVPPEVAGAFVVGADGTSLWARDTTTGAPRWTRAVDTASLPNYVTRIAAAPAAVCVATAAGSLSCLKPEDGSLLWEQPVGARPTAGPVVAAGRVALGFADGRVRAFAIETGTPLWTRTATGAVLTLTATDARVIAGTDANLVFVFDAAKGKQKWKWRTGGDPAGEAILVGKRLYYLAYDNMLRAHNMRNGHLAWSRVLSSRPVGGPVAIGDRVLVASVAPQLRAFKVTDGTPDGVVALLGKVIHQPQIVAATEDMPPMLVVVTGGGQMQAIGQTIEPAVVPLETLPGARLIADTLKR
jgi:outer membrane protein assembly factor BamB